MKLLNNWEKVQKKKKRKFKERIEKDEKIFQMKEISQDFKKGSGRSRKGKNLKKQSKKNTSHMSENIWQFCFLFSLWRLYKLE